MFPSVDHVGAQGKARFLAVVPSCSLLCYLLVGAKLVTLVPGLRASSIELGATLMLFVHKCCVDRYRTRKPYSVAFPLAGIFFGWFSSTESLVDLEETFVAKG
jgi:hypothetical protein